MTAFQRIQVLGTVLALTGIVSHSHLWGDSGAGLRDQGIVGGSRTVPARPERAAPSSEDLATAKFAQPGIVTYQDLEGTNYFGFAMKPKLDPAEKRGRDVLIMVDTSASQVGLPLRLANDVANQIVKTADAADRVSLWTVNTPAATRNLTSGFKAPASADLGKAMKALRDEVPLGSTDLQSGLAKAIATFRAAGRDGPQVILFLGDGFSTYNPISAADRAVLCDRMVNSKIRFYPVPLGPKLDSQNLHGFATATGGLLVRIGAGDNVEGVARRLQAAFDAPVLYPTEFKLSPDVQTFFPAKLPPLRGDVPTLVVGKFAPAKALTCDVEGQVAGRRVHVQIRENVLAPEPDNFFLATTVNQWRNEPDRPALMRGDRALALAQQINLVARDELLGQGQMALLLDERKAARQLFDQARKLDPNDPEAKGGLALIDALNRGAVKREDFKEQRARRDGQALLIEKRSAPGGKVEFRRDEMRRLLALARVDQNPPAGGAAALPPAAEPGDLGKQARLKQAVEEQHVNQIVNDALHQARRLLPTDPDAAVDVLKRIALAVRDNADLRPAFRQELAGRLEAALRNAATDGIRARRDREERLVQLAVAEQRLAGVAATVQDQERTRERLRRYRNLMNQARFEDAFIEGQALVQDAVNQGRPVSVAATAAADVGLAAHNLREVQEIKRLSQERYLATLLQVERSHVPFPDEPPVQFPPAAQWKRLSALRKERYENSGLTDDDPQTLKKLKELKTKMEAAVTLDGFEPNTPLKEALGFVSERYGITILLDTEAFKSDLQIMEPDNQPVKLPKMASVRLETVLRLLLAQASATFIIRRDYVEVTTPQRQAAEKTIRVYPVGDLVTPIPNSVNQQAVNQTQMNSLLGIGGGIGGFGGGGFNGIGGFGGGGFNGIGGFGGGGFNGIGGFGGGGFNGIGGFGGGGFNGIGGFGGGGFNGIGGFGGGGFNGIGGFGGGFGQAQGGGAGGNQGGQFGLQGGDTSALLVRLITQVVGKPEDWAPFQNGANQGMFGNGGMMGMMGMMGMFGGMMMGIPPVDPNEGYGNVNEAGSLGYYAPTRALIVKGTSRIHTRLGGGLLAPRPPAGGAGAGALLIEPGKKPIQVAGAGARRGDKTSAKTVKDLKAKPPTELVHLDPKTVWQDALARSRYEPGLIIATSDLLVERGEFEHNAEFLKADLRNGAVVRPWIYEALALSLRLGKGSIEDVERAEVSAIDLEPAGADGYLRASKVMAENRRWDNAVAFCKQAALLSPDSPRPYVDALTYAREAKNVDAVEWASAGLLKHDWPFHNETLHARAQDELRRLQEVLKKEKAGSDVLRRLESARGHVQRDLVVTLSWEGQADLDLEIKEPIATVCSFQQRQTPGGGTLLGDNLKDASIEKYVAGEAFSGTYEITIKRVWGRPRGSKATVQAVAHEGTPQERIILRETIVADFEKQTPTLKVTLVNGRRTSVATVAAMTNATPADERAGSLESGDQVLNKLRALADPEPTRGRGVRGGFGNVPTITTTLKLGAPRLATGKASSLIGNGLDMTYKPIVTPDGKVLGAALNPVFQTLGRSGATPSVLNPAIPGVR